MNNKVKLTILGVSIYILYVVITMMGVDLLYWVKEPLYKQVIFDLKEMYTFGEIKEVGINAWDNPMGFEITIAGDIRDIKAEDIESYMEKIKKYVESDTWSQESQKIMKGEKASRIDFFICADQNPPTILRMYSDETLNSEERQWVVDSTQLWSFIQNNK